MTQFVNEPGTTGRMLVLLAPGTTASLRKLRNTAGLTVASASDFADGALDMAGFAGADGIFLDELGVAVIDAKPDEQAALSVAAADESNASILAAEPERFVFATDAEMPTNLAGSAALMASTDYLQGCLDASRSFVELMERALGEKKDRLSSAAAEISMQDEPETTWGLEAIGAAKSRYTGTGIKLAILDTGIDLTHPDFGGRLANAQTFIEDESVQDGRGHGTHCAGTACGPEHPDALPRYGVAPGAEVYVAKVLGDSGRGSDGTLLAGLRWAVREGCAIASMSLEKGVLANETFSPIFEEVAKTALTRGTVIVAAAGNKSQRPFAIRPVSHPANCPSILAVAAIDPAFNIAPFSNAGLQNDGGKVDFAAPGVNVYSAWPLPRKYHRLHGTSMATPHVAGVAALWAEAEKVTGAELINVLRTKVQKSNLSANDVGDGLIHAP